jgi:hypothetical protein
MTDPWAAPDPYRPPIEENAGPPAPGADQGGVAARVAGAFLLLRALRMLNLGWFSIVDALDGPGGPRVVGATVAAQTLSFVIDVLLAVPLLRGSVRYRVPTWARAGLAVTFPLLQGAVSLIFRSHQELARATHRMWDSFAHNTLPAALFAAALILLVHRGRRPWRLAAGLVSVAGYVLWIAYPDDS